MPTGVIICSRGRRQPKCRWCQRPSTKLCDKVISHPNQVTHKKTCDKPMCDLHAKSVGPNIDHCPVHAKVEPARVRVRLLKELELDIGGGPRVLAAGTIVAVVSTLGRTTMDEIIKQGNAEVIG